MIKYAFLLVLIGPTARALAGAVMRAQNAGDGGLALE
jgi:hypothetical protein